MKAQGIDATSFCLAVVAQLAEVAIPPRYPAPLDSAWALNRSRDSFRANIGRKISSLAPRLPDRPDKREIQVFDFRGNKLSPAGAASPGNGVRSGFRRGTAPSPRGGPKSSRVMHARFQEVPSWLTPSGVAMKRKDLEKKGLPDFKGWRFVTLTLDPARFNYCPLAGYLAGKDHMRRFLEAGRIAGLWPRGTDWAWKLEFQSNGWAHWHLLLDRKAKFSEVEMFKVHDIWGLGRTNIRRISRSDFGYQFKYAFKGVFQDATPGSRLCVPEWFLEYMSSHVVTVKWVDPETGLKMSQQAEKPLTFSRVRFWQTSKGFYSNPAPSSTSSEPSSSILPVAVSVIMDRRDKSVVVIARDAFGKYIQSKRLLLAHGRASFIRAHLWDSENGAACTLGGHSLATHEQTIQKQVDTSQSWQLLNLLSKNRLSLHHALYLRRNQVSLESF